MTKKKLDAILLIRKKLKALENMKRLRQTRWQTVKRYGMSSNGMRWWCWGGEQIDTNLGATCVSSWGTRDVAQYRCAACVRSPSDCSSAENNNNNIIIIMSRDDSVINSSQTCTVLLLHEKTRPLYLLFVFKNRECNYACTTCSIFI